MADVLTSSSRRGAPSAADFPVVGIGCSAGGLAALEKFLAGVPAQSGMAFVIVQHLDPTHASILVELLQHVTPMTVQEVTEGTTIQADWVYIIPPNKDLSMLHGVLHLLDPVERRGLRLPIDFFLRSLAEDRREKAIGVILSGMGADGVLGLGAIKEKTGLVLVQDPASAQADSMPSAAIEAGMADIVALPEEMPSRIAAYLKVPPKVLPDAPAAKAAVQRDLDEIVTLLRGRSENDFALYKGNTISRRVERRIALNQLETTAEYVRYVRGNPQELDFLFKELLIGVTEFFRDTEVWEYLSATAIPALLARQPDGKCLRAWVPACSTGEEAYSLAIVFREAMDRARTDIRFKVKIYATDLNPDAIAKARKGYFSSNIAAGVSLERLSRYFAEEADGFVIRKEIRDMVVFAPQNIISDPPFIKLDILSCRNLLIYFRPELQAKLLPLFSYALNPGGLLLLGNSETAGAFGQLFAPVNSKAHLYQRVAPPRSPSDLALSGKPSDDKDEEIDAKAPQAGPSENIGRLTNQLIQQTYAPAAVLVNGDGDLLYISGHTGKYLEPAAGKVNINIYAMAREGLLEALPGVIRRALQQPQAVTLNGLQIHCNGNIQTVNVTVQAIEKPEPLRGRVIIVFNDVATPPVGRKSRKIAGAALHDGLVLELQQTREALQATHEEMQTSLAELTSSNEEQQSTNEELMTSKEEMQSLNEELQTAIAERQSRVESLTLAQTDMENLLNSTEIATVFLDNGMLLRRFTSHVTKLFKLIPGDIGRPLSDIATDLDYPRLCEDAKDVLRSLLFQEKQAGTGDGGWYRVRIMPYRTLDDVINGVVITFTEISEIKTLEEKLKTAEAQAPPKGSE